MHKINTNSFHSRLIDMTALTISFLLFAIATDHLHPLSILFDAAVYVSIVFVCLRLSKRFVFDSFRSSSRMVRVLLGNLLGFVSGVTLLLALQTILPFVHGETAVIIFSSVLAFFILGTLSPMVKSSNLDIIHH
jgi:hypothetical protein